MYVEYTDAVLNGAAHFNTVHFNPGSCSTLLLSADNLVSGCSITPLPVTTYRPRQLLLYKRLRFIATSLTIFRNGITYCVMWLGFVMISAFYFGSRDNLPIYFPILMMTITIAD